MGFAEVGFAEVSMKNEKLLFSFSEKKRREKVGQLFPKLNNPPHTKITCQKKIKIPIQNFPKKGHISKTLSRKLKKNKKLINK